MTLLRFEDAVPMHIAASALNPEQAYKLMTGIVVPHPIAQTTKSILSGAA